MPCGPARTHKVGGNNGLAVPWLQGVKCAQARGNERGREQIAKDSTVPCVAMSSVNRLRGVFTAWAGT